MGWLLQANGHHRARPIKNAWAIRFIKGDEPFEVGDHSPEPPYLPKLLTFHVIMRRSTHETFEGDMPPPARGAWRLDQGVKLLSREAR